MGSRKGHFRVCLYWPCEPLRSLFFARTAGARTEANRIEMGGAELKFVPNSLYYGDCLDVLGEPPRATEDRQ